MIDRYGEKTEPQTDTDNCNLCDNRGRRLPECRTVCDHTDRTHTHRNGIAAARAALNGHPQAATHA